MRSHPFTPAPARSSLGPAALCAALAIAGCDLGSYSPPASDAGLPGFDGAPDDPQAAACSIGCHGSDDQTAPPVDVSGNTDPSATGVGAHRSHLGTSSWHRELVCDECHVVPDEIAAAGHLDTPLPAELTFGGSAGETQWNGQTCASSYCHGASLSGGSATEPKWTVVDGSQSVCGSCHGLPPPAPHPAGDDCGQCHPTMNPGDGLVIAYPALHIDGVLDVSTSIECDGCHGSDGEAAPPSDVAGNTATSERGVGAHRAHLAASDWRAPVECGACHVVPKGISDVGHTDTDLPAELSFSQLAGDASWNGTSCAGSYCHGATLAGGNATSPVWTTVDGTQSECGSCHGAPPPPPHPTSEDCGTCHPTMLAGAGLVIAYPALHIDGNLDVDSDAPCDSCHGSGGVDAPPMDTIGNSDTTARGVGAHRRHLGVSTWHAEVACEECHVVPTSVVAVGHRDTPLPAEVTFGPLAGDATWDGTRCSNAYCHGAGLAGGAVSAPVWTQVDGSQAQCDSCHGAPPPPPHPAGDCGACHPTMNPGEGLVIAIPSRHIDGNLDVDDDAACDSCHGGGGNAAPPADTSGNTATTARGVGAHREHLGASGWHREIECDECHRVPATPSAVGHADTPLPAEVTFGGLSGSAVWNGATCASSYCHGATLEGGAATTPRWTLVDGTQSECDSCHGAPPPAPHPVNDDCGACHDTMAPGGGLTIIAPARHIDGNLDVTTDVACDSCHGGGGEPAPPQDVGGATATSARGVGAHRRHLGASSWHREIACDECHRVPTAVGSVGHTDTSLPAELVFGALSGSVVWNGATCTNSYCHGATLAGGTETSPAWTTVDGSASACDACHGLPPPAPHPSDTQCQNCHGDVAGPGMTISVPARHIDGVLQVSSVHPDNWVEPDPIHGDVFNVGGPGECATAACHGVALDGGASGISCNDCHSGWRTSCTFCHGGRDNTTGAPPETVDGRTARTAIAVGAHTDHVEASPTHAPQECRMCHTEPSSALSPGHVDGDGVAEVVFSSLNSAASFDSGTGQCSSLYCHGNGRTSAGSERWTLDPTYDCNDCHTQGGLSGKHGKHLGEGVDCDDCHRSVVSGRTNIIAPALHVDGTKQIQLASGTYQPSTGTCSGLASGCHGSKRW